jgi:hypothetical protein
LAPTLQTGVINPEATMSRTIVGILFLLLAPIGGCSSSSSTDNSGETAGQLGNGPAGYGCSNELIRQQQARCAMQCPAEGLGSSNGVKSCMTDDPSGQGGNVQAPCDCAGPTLDLSPSLDMSPSCGPVGYACCPGSNSCNGSLVCRSSVCCIPDGVGTCVTDADCCGGSCDAATRICGAK